MTIQHISAAIQQTPLCSKVDKTKLISILAVEIARTVSRAGHTMDENDLLFTCEEVAQLILEDYYPLHIGELPMIIRAGVFEKFGSYYGVNAVSINRWIASYIIWTQIVGRRLLKRFCAYQQNDNFQPKHP